MVETSHPENRIIGIGENIFSRTYLDPQGIYAISTYTILTQPEIRIWWVDLSLGLVKISVGSLGRPVIDISGDGKITKFIRRLFARLIQQSTQTAINTLKHKHVELSGFEGDDLEKHDLMKDILGVSPTH